MDEYQVQLTGDVDLHTCGIEGLAEYSAKAEVVWLVIGCTVRGNPRITLPLPTR